MTGTAALLCQYRPDLSASEVTRRIVGTTDPAPGGPQDGYGSGVLNPYRAVVETGTGPLPTARPAMALPAERADPALPARRHRRAAARDRALLVATVAGGLVGAAVLLAVVLPRGTLRRWHPARST